MNHKKVYRVYREAGLLLRTQRRRTRASQLRMPPPVPNSINERWAVGFVRDALADGRHLRALTVIDTYSRENLEIHVGHSLGSAIVTEVLDPVIAQRGKPSLITTDNGTEFTSNHFEA